MSSVVLPADRIATDGFTGTTLTPEEVDAAQLGGHRVGILVTTPHHVRLLPRIVQRAARTKLFLTRPVDVLPTSTLGEVTQHLPVAARAIARLHRWRAVPEKELRRKLTPLGTDVPRVLSADFHRAVQHPRCQVIAWPVTGVVALGVRTADGLEHHLDVLITC